MVKAGKTIKNSNFLIFGITVKEDCPNMCNTKVIAIIEELIDFGMNIDVYDPWIDSDEEDDQKIYRTISNPLKNMISLL
jgi:UDP-N-acetyl-D-galactosamine dehydrogenase